MSSSLLTIDGAPVRVFLTFKQWREKETKRLMAEYELPRAEVTKWFGDRSSEWITEVQKALLAGAIPSQAWINATNAPFALEEWTWWKSFLHNNPPVADRLSRAGRLWFRTRKQLLSRTEEP